MHRPDQSFHHAFMRQLLHTLPRFCPVSPVIPALHPVSTYPYPGHIPFLHTTRNEVGALGRPESACAYTRTASVACNHHRDSETWNRWTQQVIDWQPTRAIGALRTHCATKLKIPIRLWGFLFDFRCLFLNQDQRTARLCSLRSSVTQHQLDIIQSLPLSFFHSLHWTNIYSLKREKGSLKHPWEYAIHWISLMKYFSNSWPPSVCLCDCLHILATGSFYSFSP